MASTMSNTAPPPGAGSSPDASLLRQTTLDGEDGCWPDPATSRKNGRVGQGLRSPKPATSAQTRPAPEDAAALLASLADCAPPEELEWRRRLSRLSLRRSLTPKGPLPGKAGGE